MKLLEINQYSGGYHIPKSKKDVRDDSAYKRLYYGKGLIDIDSIVSVEPEGKYDEETLEFTHNTYRIYFKDNDTRVYTDDEGYELIKEYCLNNQKTPNDIILEDKNTCSSEKNIEKDFRTEAEKYLRDIESAFNKLKNNINENNTGGGIFKLFKDKDNTEEEQKYIKFISTLTWDKLQNMMVNNKNINLEGLYPENSLIIPEEGPILNTYYNIIKNSLYKKLSESIEIKYNYKEPENNIKKLLLAELSDYLDTFIDNVIKKYDKEIFDYLFGKIYLNENNV